MANFRAFSIEFDTSSSLDQFLLQDKLLAEHVLQDAKKYCAVHQMALTHHLVHANYLSGEQILSCCARHFALPVFKLHALNLTVLHADLMPVEWMYRFRIIPLRDDLTTLLLGVTDPTCYAVISKVRFHLGLSVQLALVNEEELEALLSSIFSDSLTGSLQSLVHEIVPAMIKEPTVQIQQHESDDEPIIKLVNQLLADGAKYRASDIHCEPSLNYYRVRFRIDGWLYEKVSIPTDFALRMIARIKLLASLDVTEKRLPQDGRIGLQTYTQLEIRVSTCPTVLGEKVVLRLFKQHQEICHLEQLGLLQDQLQHVQQAIKKPYGLIIVSGPTGSGKTMTLYAILQALKDAAINIMTIEEPVEMQIPGVNQVQVNARIGLSFAQVLRAMLRQDPDVIMLGEIRDAETAHIALQAASTGHLVLGTVHANHALSVLSRLVLLGLNVLDCLQVLVMIIAQRLVRQLCRNCHGLGVPACSTCQEGYHGRIGVFEVLLPDDHFISLVTKQVPMSDIVAMLKQKGWLSLYAAAMQKVTLGMTSLFEVERVVGHG